MPWFDQDSEAPQWLAKLTRVQRMGAAAETEQWTMFRGDPARNAVTAGSAPLLNLRWRAVISDEPLESQLRAELDSYHQRGANVLAGLHPLAVGDIVFIRTAMQLRAIDYLTGKLIWQTEPEEQTDSQPNRNNGFARQVNMSQSAQYGQRVWDDATYGTLSSDGNLVFSVEQLNMGVTAQYNFIMVGPGQGDRERRSVTNKLTAYELRTGRLKWALGGDELMQPDTFFLGPPLPLRGQLFVIAEVKDEIRLLALDAATGNELWHQQLAMVDANISQDPVRRLAGVSPSYADGVLICPTGSGCAVAVDLSAHSLQWGYIYPPPGQAQASPYNMGGRRGRGMNQIQMQFTNPNGPVPRWLDGTATIAGGRVLFTPAEADGLYCLNLADGKPCWQAQLRGDHYYIACVHNGIVVLVGRNSIDAINLEDGNKAWGPITFPSGETVSGHGFYAGNRYYVPVSTSLAGGTTGEVLTVDVSEGKIVGSAKGHHSAPPGNLVAYRGHIVSQGLDGVELYYQVDAARAESTKLLAANKDDVEGLTLRGEIAMDEGRSSDAVADFRRAYALDENQDSHIRTRELLRDALLNGLRDNFALHRPLAGAREKLLDVPSPGSADYRRMTMGLQRAGDWRQAVEYCLRIVDMEDKPLRPETVDRSYLARRDCWVRARLGVLRSEGGAAAAAEIDKLLAPRLEDAKKDTGPEKLQRFVSFFDGQPAAAAARTELFGRLAQAGRLMEAELLLSSSVDSGDRQAQAGLLAELAALNLRANRADDAAACYRELARQFPDTPCQGNLKPAAWLAVLANGDSLRKQIAAPPASWPTGLVEVTPGESPRAFNNGRGPHYDLVLTGPAGPFFTDCTVTFEQTQQEVDVRNGWGHMKAQMRLVENGRMFGYYNPNTTIARTCGHLLFVAVGTKIYALDPWRASGSENRANSILWSQDLTDASGDSDLNLNGGVLAVNAAIAFANANSMGNFHANPFGPVNARVVCFQRVRNLVAVDPYRGETLWVRQDIPANSEVFGDDQYVFVLSPGSAEATVYRAIDGEFLGTRKMPQIEQNDNSGGNYPNYSDNYERSNALALTGSVTLARYVLTWTHGSDQSGRVLSLFDPWLQKAVWPERTFASGSRVDVVEHCVAAVLEPGGHFVLVDLRDGHTIADLQLKLRPHFPVMDMLVAHMGDQYIVVTQDRRSVETNNNEDQMQPLQGMLSYTLRRSRIYAIDMQGKLAWPEPVDIDYSQFPLSQPGRLPVLVFCSFHFDRQNQNQSTFRTVVTAVDRRNGRVVCDENRVMGMQNLGLEVAGDPVDKTVHMSVNQQNFAMKFTDKPLGKAVRYTSGAPKPSGKLGDALL